MAIEKAKTIAALRRQLKSVTNETAKKALTKKIERLKTELEAEKTPTKQLAMQLSKARAEINAMSKSDFNAMIKKLAMKPEYSFLKGMTKQEIKDDLDREAKPVGWRFRGRDNFKKPTKADIKQGKKVYYENRPNRSDVIHPAKLMQGGKLVPKELSTAWEEKTEDINRLNSIIERIRVKEGSTPNVKRMQKQLMRLKNERKEIFNSISKFAKGGKIQVGTFVRYKKDDDFTGGKVITINNDQAEIHNWDGSTIKLPVKDLEYVESWNRKMAFGGMVYDLSYDAIDRMEGLAPISEMQVLNNNIIKIYNSLEEEGFEKDEIASYLSYKTVQYLNRKMAFGGMVYDLSYDAIDRMEGLAPISEMQVLNNNIIKIYNSLEEEGFEKDEIASYLSYKTVQYLNKMTRGGSIEVGDKVKASKEYGGKSGTVIEKRGSFLVVEDSKGKTQSYHESDLVKKYSNGGGVESKSHILQSYTPKPNEQLVLIENFDGYSYKVYAVYVDGEYDRRIKVSKYSKGGKTDFGMLSVKAGIDNNPNPTYADKIAGAKMKKMAEGGGVDMKFQVGDYVFVPVANPNTKLVGKILYWSDIDKMYYVSLFGGGQYVRENDLEKATEKDYNDYMNKLRSWSNIGYAQGGGVEEENREMVINNNVQIMHHTHELKEAVKKAKHIPAWVVAKVFEATSALSNVTHYLDGTTKMATGGGIKNQYKGKSYNEIWDNWTSKQRQHFIEDHLIEFMDVANTWWSGKDAFLPEIVTYKSEDLPYRVYNSLVSHVKSGQYATGGGVGKKIVVETYKGKVEFNNQDIQEMIDDIDMYISSDNLPAWIYKTGKAGHPDFPKNKKNVIEVLEKIKNSNNDVYINVSSKDPYYKHIIQYSKGGSLKGNQHKLDMNKNGRLDAEDFKILRGKK